ncbi:PTS system nitrogen regulatory IIA component [Desulfosalsimonas propionicica]|uniref:PTS system nitrogen regulatory IIA component n=1 Tax=Desulfosalsimonas propionicica TaxID=332175 RepID=A0A7W0C7D5_9BACT|nr:PTS sugar transporter subunit IIA [Desulfosalsimonas propionicica]MBA2880405.1 PTS system nitrogen regulatory IIA component [Desulfosalsimonas propionicica]
MKILDYITADTILTNLQATDKKGVIDELTEPVAALTGLEQRNIVRVLIERERLGSTGIGDGIAIPHGKINGIESLVLGFGLSRKGVNFDALDGKPAYIFFLLLSADNSTGLHLRVLARISKLLRDQDFKEKLKRANSAQQVMDVLSEVDEDF